MYIKDKKNYHKEITKKKTNNRKNLENIIPLQHKKEQIKEMDTHKNKINDENL